MLYTYFAELCTSASTLALLVDKAIVMSPTGFVDYHFEASCLTLWGFPSWVTCAVPMRAWWVMYRDLGGGVHSLENNGSLPGPDVSCITN